MLRIKQAVVVLVLIALPSVTATAPSQGGLDQQYGETAERIIQAALNDNGGWEKLAYLCDRIGHRLSGSPQLEQAVSWAAEQMRADGLENVRLQQVKVPHWVRGNESARMLAPVERPLNMLGLGMSVGTPPEGITASVVAVSNFDELEALGKEKVAGKIVLYDVPFEGYGRTARYRSAGPSRAAQLGAVAVLLRSVTPLALYAPHTGALRYDPEAPQIPAAAITLEEAGWIHRLVDAGVEVKVRLSMEARLLPEADSANVIGEIVGRETPEEVVVIGGHIDSWDVGQGAHDDGGGVVTAMHALAVLKKLDLRPRRTLRVVAWTNEENGGAGGAAYRAGVGNDIHNHVAAIEMDGGAEKPVGFGLGLRTGDGEEGATVRERALGKVGEIGRLLEGIEAGAITGRGGGADIGPLMRDGVPGMALRTVGDHYFDWHHTNADTLDKVNPDDLRRAIAAMAVMSYILADMPERLVEPTP